MSINKTLSKKHKTDCNLNRSKKNYDKKQYAPGSCMFDLCLPDPGTVEIITDPYKSIKNQDDFLLAAETIFQQIAGNTSGYMTPSRDKLKKVFLETDRLVIISRTVVKKKKIIRYEPAALGSLTCKPGLYLSSLPLYYIHAVICNKTLKNNLGLYTVTSLVQSIEELGKKSFLIGAFTQNNKVINLARMLTPTNTLFISSTHWKNLNKSEKSEYNRIINTCDGKSTQNVLNCPLNDRGIYENRYSICFRADPNPAPTRNLNLKDDQAVFLLTTIPADILDFINNPDTKPDISNRFFHSFVKAYSFITTCKKTCSNAQ